MRIVVIDNTAHSENTVSFIDKEVIQLIKNFLDAKKQSLAKSHDGSGQYDLYEIWNRADFSSNVDFIDRVVIPPNSTVGYHKHANNEEIYIVIEGQGAMNLNGKDISIKKGDMILNQPFGEHGLVNNSDSVIDILVIQVSI
ncbi:cupin domain-containing protein [Shewanella sp. 10N.286.45.A1]|uniref:cupin domain-containing protein n=1 Tax=Shewanella sp. 10N.286.45.A1 TaxID=3229694 RepID=UPI00355284B7